MGFAQTNQERFGDAVILALIERESQTRVLLHVPSMRSERYGEVSRNLFELTDIILSCLGFDWQEDVEEIRYQVEDILSLPLCPHFGTAVTAAVETMLSSNDYDILVFCKVLNCVMEEVLMQQSTKET